MVGDSRFDALTVASITSPVRGNIHELDKKKGKKLMAPYLLMGCAGVPFRVS
jgi:hypothetical protein